MQQTLRSNRAVACTGVVLAVVLIPSTPSLQPLPVVRRVRTSQLQPPVPSPHLTAGKLRDLDFLKPYQGRLDVLYANPLCEAGDKVSCEGLLLPPVCCCFRWGGTFPGCVADSRAAFLRRAVCQALVASRRQGRRAVACVHQLRTLICDRRHLVYLMLWCGGCCRMACTPEPLLLRPRREAPHRHCHRPLLPSPLSHAALLLTCCGVQVTCVEDGLPTWICELMVRAAAASATAASAAAASAAAASAAAAPGAAASRAAASAAAAPAAAASGALPPPPPRHAGGFCRRCRHCRCPCAPLLRVPARFAAHFRACWCRVAWPDAALFLSCCFVCACRSPAPTSTNQLSTSSRLRRRCRRPW